MQVNITEQTPLAVSDIGLITPLANDWKETATRIHAGEKAFKVPKWCVYPVAEIPLEPNCRGLTRLAHLVLNAINNLNQRYSNIPIVLALPDEANFVMQANQLPERFMEIVNSIPALKAVFTTPNLEMCQQGQCSLAIQLDRARDILNTTDHKQVMIIAVDTYLYPQTLTSFEGRSPTWRPLAEQQPKMRVLWNGRHKKNTDGFVPSEAAGVLVVEKGEESPHPLQITGVGVGREPATLLSKQPNNGDGLADAINQACDNANASFTDHTWRIASMSGEEYFEKEASAAQTSCSDKEADETPLWKPASHIGETGCVVGIAMVAMVMDSFNQDYALGNRALCHMSNDNQQRAAFSVTYRKTK